MIRSPGIIWIYDSWYQFYWIVRNVGYRHVMTDIKLKILLLKARKIGTVITKCHFSKVIAFKVLDSIAHEISMVIAFNNTR